jgi:hypothetical protein
MIIYLQVNNLRPIGHYLLLEIFILFIQIFTINFYFIIEYEKKKIYVSFSITA